MSLAFRFPQLQFGLACLVLAGALVLGGGQGTPGDSAVQIGSLMLIAICLWRHATDPEARLPRAAWIATVPVALALLMLLPLPSSAWAWAEARPAIAEELAIAGVEPAHRWSLVPVASELALHWLFPAVAMYLATLQLQSKERKRLLALVVLVAAGSVVLGFAQLFGGTQSSLRFYEITNAGASVGFFANRNHFASLLAVCLPLVVVGTMAWYQRRESGSPGTWLGVVAGVGLVALFILGIAIARSRAGLLLGMLGLLLCLPVVLRMRRRRGSRRTLALALAVGFTLVMQFALFGILQRLEQDPLDDARFTMLPAVAETAKAHGPWGAGLGGFRRAFEARDPAPQSDYINHAHNDWAELWVDAGPLSVGLAGLGIVILAFASWRAWPRDPGAMAASNAAPALSAALALWLLALHSLGDYPLRTTALLAVAGLLVGIVAHRAGIKRRKIHLSEGADEAKVA